MTEPTQSKKLSEQDQFKLLMKSCRRDPNNLVSLIWSDIKLSNQQSELFREMGKITIAKQKRAKGKSLTAEEKRYSEYIGINVPSGMGLGKDFAACIAGTHFLISFPKVGGSSPRVFATANTATQLKNVLWNQWAQLIPMSKKINPDDPKSPTILSELLVHQSQKIFRKDDNTSFAEAITIPPHASSDVQARSLTGRHAEYMLMILDEAAGLPEAVFTSLEGTLTGRVNLILMIYNPIKSRGYVAEACEDSRWLTLRWNGEETDFYDDTRNNSFRSRNNDLLKKYGRESNPYRIRVLGLPPIECKDVFFPWEWVQNSVNNGLEPDENDLVIMGVDPAVGGDKSVIVVRKGCKIVDILRFNEPDLTKFTYNVTAAADKWNPVTINVDSIGVGANLPSRLRELGYPAYNADVRRTARDRSRFKLVRDELWVTLRDQFEKGNINIPNDTELVDQLGCITIKDYAAKGVLTVPTKAQMKRDIGHSPDEADGICLTYAIPDDELLRREYPPQEEEGKDIYGNENSATGY